MKKPKDVEIKARITRRMRADLEAIADKRQESLSLIVREAAGEYLAKHRPIRFANNGRERK